MLRGIVKAQPHACPEACVRSGSRQGKGFLLTLLLAATVGTSCAKRVGPTPCETPPPMQVVLDVSEQVNPDPRGRSLPTVVQVIQLKDSAKLERAGFRDLWGRPKEFLGEDLLQVAEFTVAPGQKVQRWIQRDPKARFILTMGHFRQPLGYSWRTVIALDPVLPPFCVERPAGDQGEPRPGDVQLRYRLQGYQIDILRTFSLTQPAPAVPSATEVPSHPKGSA
ncbi:type VI secretion system lipoprotein TssJ [Archangium sp.]|uniref:type VI secretion system lipoprotein TssJ n=1 Tax=Archangium sp. TaxID=1872627 RepID=UPI0039C8B7E4